MTDYCCTPDSGDCCGPGSWCCGKAGKHDHLARAPKPKPAWHDAIAVIAGPRDDRQVYALVNDGVWESSEHVLYSDELTGVTPLIVAEVTDEMVKRGAQASNPAGVRYLRPHEVREVLTAALGLDPA